MRPGFIGNLNRSAVEKSLVDRWGTGTGARTAGRPVSGTGSHVCEVIRAEILDYRTAKILARQPDRALPNRRREKVRVGDSSVMLHPGVLLRPQIRRSRFVFGLFGCYQTRRARPLDFRPAGFSDRRKNPGVCPAGLPVAVIFCSCRGRTTRKVILEQFRRNSGANAGAKIASHIPIRPS